MIFFLTSLNLRLEERSFVTIIFLCWISLRKSTLKFSHFQTKCTLNFLSKGHRQFLRPYLKSEHLVCYYPRLSAKSKDHFDHHLPTHPATHPSIHPPTHPDNSVWRPRWGRVSTGPWRKKAFSYSRVHSNWKNYLKRSTLWINGL